MHTVNSRIKAQNISLSEHEEEAHSEGKWKNVITREALK